MNSDLILPAIASLSVVLVCVGKLYYKIRPKFPVKVNCWFCNTNTTVPYNSSNSWYCHQCDQYNGFSSDGGYNRLLPEQFNQRLNPGSWCSNTKKKSATHNGLCQFCNINLELKIHQLAQFVPLNQENYDEEIQQYSDQLERVYRLCLRCQNVLTKTLCDKEDIFIKNHHTFTATLTTDHSKLQPAEKERHFVYLGLTAMLSVGLLLSLVPFEWASHLLTNYSPPEPIIEVLSLAQQYFPKHIQSSAFLSLGAVVQLFDCVHMKDSTSFVNLLLWVILLSLNQVPVQVEGLMSVVYMLASIVFLITSLTEYKSGKPKSIAAVKPVQFTKIGGTPEFKQGRENLAEVELNKPLLSKSPVSDSSPIRPVLPLSHESCPEDFGFGKLHVSSRRITRSQTKPFQTKSYGSQAQTNLFRPKSVNLTPPKLQLEKVSDYQVPLTRSSSQSSGFVSLSHQKDFEDYQSPFSLPRQRDFEEYQSPTVLVDNIDSVSQCGGPLTPYQSPFVTPTSFSNPYGMPFSHFQPYAIMHFTPPHFNKFYQYSNMSYEPSLNLSTFNVNRSAEADGWFQHLKTVLSPLLFVFLITSNVAVLWKVFGEEHFKIKT